MPNFPTPISPKAAILAKRHITNEQADILQVGPMPMGEVMGHLGYMPKGSISYAEALPYWDAEGHPLGEPQFYRFKINYTPGWEPPEGDWEDYPKYRSPRRKGEFAYLARGLGMDWLAILGEPTVPLIFTEGEYKSIRACSAWDQPCIGLGGIWMFHASKPGWPAGLENVNFHERECYVVFDADRESTEEVPLRLGRGKVDAAAKRLANKLYQEGAVPWLLYIARTETFRKARIKDINAKMGLDDYIDAGGTWAELLETRENPIQHDELARIMEEWAMYTGPGPGIARTNNGDLYRVTDFHNIEANAVGTTLDDNGKTKVVRKIKFSQVFMEHKDRPEFNRYIFEPSLSPGLDRERGTFNRWRGMVMEGAIGPGEAERYREIVAMWRAFIVPLCGGEEHADYFEQWVGDLFQNPGRKTTIAMLLRSSLNGIGKSLLGEVIMDIVGPKHSVRMGLDDAVHHFNALMGDRVFIQIDEANDFRKEHDSALKNMITAEECVVTLKGRDSVVIKNYARIFVTSNSEAPIRLDEHNRRIYVMTPNLTVEDERGEWGKHVGNVVAKVLRSEEGLRMLRVYFDTLDVSNWVPTANVPRTAAMMDVVEASSSKSGELFECVWGEFLLSQTGLWNMGGRLATMPESKMLKAKFKERLRITGGQTISHVMKIPGETGSKRVTLFNRGGNKPLETKHVPDQGLCLVSGSVTTADLLRAKEDMDKAYAEWAGVNPSTKY